MSLARSARAALLLPCIATAPPYAAAAPASPLPEVVVQMADETIARTHSLAPVRDHATAIALFGWEFLGGFLQPGMLCPGCSGVGNEGMLAGQRYRREHPERHDDLMRGYGYVLTDVDGTCRLGFESSGFTPKRDHPPTPQDMMEDNWWVTGWSNAFVGPPAPRRPGLSRGRSWPCRMTGWLSPPGGYGHMNLYGHQFLIVRSEFIPAPDSAP